MHLTTLTWTCAGCSQSMITIKVPCKDPTTPLSPDANIQDYFLKFILKKKTTSLIPVNINVQN